MTENTDTHQPSPENGNGKRKRYFKREPGQAIRSGKLVEKGFQEGKWGPQTKYVFESETSIWSVDGFRNLDDQMNGVHVGDIVDMEYDHTEISPEGKKRHFYKVWKHTLVPLFQSGNCESKKETINHHLLCGAQP